MTPASTRFLFLCVVVLSLLNGCAGLGGAPEPAGGPVPMAGADAAGEVAVYMALGLLLGVAFAVTGVVDLLCLPFAIAGQIDYFYCCRGLADLL
jgi:uncharacterized protein YceK